MEYARKSGIKNKYSSPRLSDILVFQLITSLGRGMVLHGISVSFVSFKVGELQMHLWWFFKASRIYLMISLGLL